MNAVDAVILVLGVALFLFAATMETALSNLSRTRMNAAINRGVERARRLEGMIDGPTRHIVAAQVLRILATVLTTAFAVFLLLRLAEPDTTAVLVTAAIIFLLLILLLSFPRGLALRDPESILIALHYPVVVSSALLSPIVRGLNRCGGLAARLVGLRDVSEGPVLSADDLHTHASAAAEAGLIERAEQDMIDSIIELDKTTVREIMVPRPDITALPGAATVAEALDLIADSGYSRVPVYDGSVDQILGILYAKDLLRRWRGDELSAAVRGLARTAYVVPESKKTDELLRELKLEKVHMAIVIDEYGGTAGLVTIEDLLEEIVGEIQDEYDHEEAKIVALSDAEAIVDATVSIDDVNDALELNLQGEDVDTIGGLVYERLGKVPLLGDRVALEGAELRVESTAGRRVRKVRVRRVPGSEARPVVRHAS